MTNHATHPLNSHALIVSNYPTWRDIERLARAIEWLAQVRRYPDVDAAARAVRMAARERKYDRASSGERGRTV